jgi:hypothetical protein
MQPEPSFRETRVIEPRIGQALLLRCNRTGHEYPGTAIELPALDIGGLAALIKIVPTFDSNDLIGVKARTPQKLPDYSAAGLSQCACASLRASRITRTDYQNSRFAVLSQPGGRSFQHVLPGNG